MSPHQLLVPADRVRWLSQGGGCSYSKVGTITATFLQLGTGDSDGEVRCPAMEQSGYLLDGGGDTFQHQLSYMLMVLGGHPIVETRTQCLFESFSIWIPPPTKILHLPALASVGNWSPSTSGNPPPPGISFFKSICAAAICLSDSQSPVSVNCLSSALRNSSGSHFPSSTSLSSSNDSALALFPCCLVVSLSWADWCQCYLISSCRAPSWLSLGLIGTTVISWLRVVGAFIPLMAFGRTDGSLLSTNAALQLQQLDWSSFCGLRKWAASCKDSTCSFCQPFTVRPKSPWRSPSP